MSALYSGLIPVECEDFSVWWQLSECPWVCWQIYNIAANFLLYILSDRLCILVVFSWLTRLTYIHSSSYLGGNRNRFILERESKVRVKRIDFNSSLCKSGAFRFFSMLSIVQVDKETMNFFKVNLFYIERNFIPFNSRFIIKCLEHFCKEETRNHSNKAQH